MIDKNVHWGLRRLLLIIGAVVMSFSVILNAQPVFSDYFLPRTLRVDYYHSGNKNQDRVAIDRLYDAGPWAGPQTRLLDNLNLGYYQLRVIDSSSEELIYTRGFSTLFNEWQSTEEANAGKEKVLHETLRMPFPKNSVKIQLIKRDSTNKFGPVFYEGIIDPQMAWISNEKRDSQSMVFSVLNNGDPENHVDISFLAEGYAQDEAGKFLQDVQRMLKALFSAEPFKSQQKAFNARAVFKASGESGTDDPRNNQYRHTPLETSFNTFNSQRYVMTEANRKMQDMISQVPTDAVVILVNHPAYGGGGILNFYACTTVDHQHSEFVFVHEFGHSFAGLGDEYYTSDVAYTDFFAEGVEPWEKNVASEVSAANIKWKRFLSSGIQLPTPWQKEKYDQKSAEYPKVIAALTEKGASESDIAKARADHQRWVDGFFDRHPMKNKVGAFEGAGYASTGLYRPALNCIMITRGAKDFDPVCQAAISEVIALWTGSTDGK